MYPQYYPGSPRQVLAAGVEDLRKELLSNDKSLTRLAAHRKAIELACKQNPDLVKAYHLDTRSA